MKAVSPVIATLILIAIAVIAGVFVLRQFLLFATTTATQQVIQIQDVVLYLATKPQPINETYTATWMSVNLQITLKNTGDRIVTVKNITVDGLPLQGFTAVNINPGGQWSGSFPVILKPPAETRILHDPAWERGTEHTVVVEYTVLGLAQTQRVAQTATVM